MKTEPTIKMERQTPLHSPMAAYPMPIKAEPTDLPDPLQGHDTKVEDIKYDSYQNLALFAPDDFAVTVFKLDPPVLQSINFDLLKSESDIKVEDVKVEDFHVKVEDANHKNAKAVVSRTPGLPPGMSALGYRLPPLKEMDGMSAVDVLRYRKMVHRRLWYARGRMGDI
jgi:hypothetical protein